MKLSIVINAKAYKKKYVNPVIKLPADKIHVVEKIDENARIWSNNFWFKMKIAAIIIDRGNKKIVLW